MLLQILAHTPRWVFALFALLVWLGVKQLLAGSVSLTRITILPLAMTGLSVYGVASAFGDSPAALIGWAGAAMAMVAGVLQRPLPAATRYDAASRSFHVPGSAVPLALMMGIFFTKYVVGVLVAMHPELAHHGIFPLAIGTLYGAFTGTFVGRSVRLWRLAIRSEAGAAAAAA